MQMRFETTLIISRGVRHIPLVFLTFTLSAQQQHTPSFNCFSVMAGKNATTDGSVMFAHNEDDYGTRIVNWYKVERMAYDSGSMVTINQQGTTIPQSRETNAYLWLDMPEMESSDTYMNEYGVVIASDACRSREDNPEITDGGIGYWLRRIMAERAHSAREAVMIGGNLVEQFGYKFSGRSYFIADPNEAWIMAVVNGKHWVAQRVPDDRVAVVPNFYTIAQVNLKDTVNFQGSPDLIDYAIKRGWYVPARGGAFNFRKAYSDPDNLIHKSNVYRMWKGIQALSRYEYALEDEFPFAFLPKEKVALADLMDLLRDHYEGTPLDVSDGYQINPHFTDNDPICSPTTQYGFIAQLRGYMPVEAGAVLWLAPYRPCVHPFIPWYNGITEIPLPYQKYPVDIALDYHFQPPEDLYVENDSLAFWYFVRHARQIDDAYLELAGKARKRSESFEKELLRKQILLEREIVYRLKDDTEKIRESVTEFTTEAAEDVLKLFK